MWLLVRASDDLKSEDRAYRDTLCAICPTAANGRDLAQRFLTMIRERQSDALDGWLNDAERSGIIELRNFARDCGGITALCWELIADTVRGLLITSRPRFWRGAIAGPSSRVS